MVRVETRMDLAVYGVRSEVEFEEIDSGWVEAVLSVIDALLSTIIPSSTTRAVPRTRKVVA